MKIGTYFSIQEVERSETAKRLGIQNVLPLKYYDNVHGIVQNLLDPLRALYGKPLYISSWYRSAELNRAIGGAQFSDHMTANAVDIDLDAFGPFENQKIFKLIKDNFKFHTLIWEFGNSNNPDWVHVSWFKDDAPKKVIKAVREHGKTKYHAY
jgi:zinc D-Ala-D-Ala carboxypeptidase